MGMPQDSGSEPKSRNEIAAAAARILEEAKAEPVPQSILDLAAKLERALEAQRRATKPGDAD